MAVQTGNSGRKTASARAISDLGALMSAKAEGNQDSQPAVVQVHAPVTPVPDSFTITTASQEAILAAEQSVVIPEAISINQAQPQEHIGKEETMSAQNATTTAPAAPAAQVATAAAPATAPAAVPTPAATAAVAEAPLSSSEVMGDANTTAPAAESTTPPTPTWAMLETLEKGLGVENLDSLDSLRSSLGARAERFNTLVAVTKDTVQRVDRLEAAVAELKKGGLTRTVKFENPDWKDNAVHGLITGAAVSVGVLGIAYAFDAMFGSPAEVPGEPAIQ